MPGPLDWSDNEYSKAQAIVQSGRGTPEQLEQLRSAVSQYEQAFPAGGSTDGVSRETSIAAAPMADPLEASRAALKAVRTGGQSRELLPEPEQRSASEAAALAGFQGMTFDYGDELAAKAASTLGLLRPESGFGEREFLGDVRQQMQEAQQQHPAISFAAQLAGGALPSSLVGGALPRTTSLGGALGQGAGVGAVAGAVSGSGAAEEGGRMEGARKGLLPGALGGAVGGGVAHGLSKGVPMAAEALRNASRRQRAAATGATPADARNLVRQQGRGKLEEFGQAVEDQGLHATKVPAAPAGLGDYAGNAEAAKAAIGPEIRAFSEEMTERGVRVDTGSVAQEMADEAKALGSMLRGASDAHVDAKGLMDRALTLAREGRPSYETVFETRKYLDDITRHFERLDDSKSADLFAGISNKLRAALYESVADSPDDLARLEALNKSFETASRTYNYAAPAEASAAVGGEPLATRTLRIASAGLTSPRGRSARSAAYRGVADTADLMRDSAVGSAGTAPVGFSDIARKIAEIREEQELERVRQSLPQ